MFKYLCLVIICAVIFADVVSAEVVKQGSMSLLAVATDGSTHKGAVADLSLEIKSGKGRVFLDTFPATKVTTQISMRFAQQVACQELDVDCSNYDFFYTLKAVQGIVGGASAGAASAVLTSALLNDVGVDKSVVITGTINSGGLIGPVGGLKDKVDAAVKLGAKKVLIPRGTRTQTIANGSQSVVFDLVGYGNESGVEVIEVATLSDALSYFGVSIPSFDDDFVIDESYNNIMKNVSVELCNRNKVLSAGLNQAVHEALNYSVKAGVEFSNNNFYSSASYCFRSNVLLKSQFYVNANLSKEELTLKLQDLQNNVDLFESNFSNLSVKSITDLETVMVVSERLDEAKEYVVKINDHLNNSNFKDASVLLGLAEERLFSAEAWLKFFGSSNSLVFDDSRLKSICESKISEAEERYNYVLEYFPDVLKNSNKLINEAFALMNKDDFVSCIYKASKAKAEADVLMSLFGVDQDRVDEIFDIKLDIVKKSIIRAQRKGIFPIISYAYFEYSSSLRDVDKGNAFLFSEYALEFSNLDIYLKKPSENAYFSTSLITYVELFVLGALFGFLIFLSLRRLVIVKNRELLKTLQTPPKRRLRGKKR